MKNHILNVEGIPGSGKSTAAAQLNDLFRAAGLSSYWVREEAQDHPIGTSRLPRTVGIENLAASYLDAWRAFVKENSQIAILDAYALQSSVRFLFAMNAPEHTLHRYFQTWQEIGKPNSSIVFLKVEDTERHFRDFVFPLRGEDWCRKISSYVSATPFGREHGLTGNSGAIEFWSRYQTVCLELLRNSVVTTQIHSYTDHSWIEAHLEFLQHAAKKQ